MSQLQTAMAEVEKIFSATEKVLLGMKDGERMHTDVFNAKASAESGAQGKGVISLIRFFVDTTNYAHVSSGKNGGVIRGTKGQKAKPQPKKAIDDESREEVDEENV